MASRFSQRSLDGIASGVDSRGRQRMSQVMVTIRFDGDADDLFDKWERAVRLWEEEFETRSPATVVAKGEHGGLFIVNLFPSDDAHTHFGRNIGGPMEAVGLSNPQLEHLDVLKSAPATNPE
jgi:hypothetical protein